MGKKFFGVIAFVAIAAVAGWNYQQNTNEVELSDLALANVEALASGEGGSVTCDPDPGDICMVGTTPVKDYDEDDGWL